MSGAHETTRGFPNASWNKFTTEADARRAWALYCLAHHVHPEYTRPLPSQPTPPSSSLLLAPSPTSPVPSPRRVAIEEALAAKRLASTPTLAPLPSSSRTAPPRESPDDARSAAIRVNASPAATVENAPATVDTAPSTTARAHTTTARAHAHRAAGDTRAVPDSIRFFAVRGVGADNILYNSRCVER